MASPSPDQDLLRTMSARFGHASFRPGQRETIEAALAGRDCLTILPTGGGKSVTYQLPALVSGRTTLVVSPLIALMRD
jgi:ATP-dependent DNA helicase RecQ